MVSWPVHPEGESAWKPDSCCCISVDFQGCSRQGIRYMPCRIEVVYDITGPCTRLMVQRSLIKIHREHWSLIFTKYHLHATRIIHKYCDKKYVDRIFLPFNGQSVI